jgi:hypothetical protein
MPSSRVTRHASSELPQVHERARAVNMDFRQWEEDRGSAQGTLVIMCEVLDNMPHDKVRISSSSGSSDSGGGCSSSALAAHVLPRACSSLSSDPSAQWTSNPDGPFVETCTHSCSSITWRLTVAAAVVMTPFHAVLFHPAASCRILNSRSCLTPPPPQFLPAMTSQSRDCSSC